MRRDMHSLRPPYFWKARRLVPIMGESMRSRRISGLESLAENAIGPADLAARST